MDALGESQTHLERCHTVGNETRRAESTCVAMEKILHATNLLWQWLAFLRCIPVNPVVEKCLS